MSDDVMRQFVGFDPDQVMETVRYCMTPAIGGAVAGGLIGATGVISLPLGVAGGFAIGFIGCARIANLKGKIATGLPMTQSEVLTAVSALQDYGDIRNSFDALKLFANIRANAGLHKGGQECRDPAFFGKHAVSSLDATMQS